MTRTAQLISCLLVLGVTGCDRTEGDWTKAKQTNSVSALRDFLAKHPQGPHVDDARSRIDGLDWKDALAKNTIAAYEAYLTANAQGAHAAEATTSLTALRDDRDWGAATAANTIDATDGYLRTYQSGKHADEAAALRVVIVEDLAWGEAKSTNTMVAMQAYLARYPSGRYAAAAKDAIGEIAWQAAQAANTVKEISDYLTSYPVGKHAQQASESIDSLDWQVAKAANTLVAWKEYLRKHKTGRFMDEAATLAEEAEWGLAVKSASVEPLAAFIRDYPGSQRQQEAKAMVLKRTEQVKANTALNDAAKLLCAVTVRNMSAKVARGLLGTLGGTKEHPLSIALTAPTSAEVKKGSAPEVKDRFRVSGTWKTTDKLSFSVKPPEGENVPKGVIVRVDPARTKVVLVSGGYSFSGVVSTKAGVVAFQNGALVTEDSADQASCSSGTTALLDGVSYDFDGKTWSKTAAVNR